jgi:hypothetical protein
MHKSKSKLYGVLLILLLLQGFMMRGVLWEPWKKNYAPKNPTEAQGLDPQQFLAVLAGFREIVAGMLWVRADGFFDEGNYDAVLPLIRMVTILDPHQIDVYATGMWHIGYNFTDEESRSDRRYLPTALALGAEGAKSNPTTYELFFETGWMWMHKVDDIYPRAVEWMKRANEHDDIAPARRNMLAKALEHDGKIDEMLDYYYKLLDLARARNKTEHSFQSRQAEEVIENNLDNLLVRMVQRGYVATKSGTYDKGEYDTKPPFELGFSAKVTVTNQNELRVEGTYNVLPLGTRIRVVLRDAKFPNAIPGGVIWDEWKEVALDPNKDLTYMQDQLYVRNQRFNKKIDMSKDPTMYPFKGEDYVIEFYYNPRSAPPHIQDKFSWNGEGLTDKNFASNKLGEYRDGVNCLYTSLPITREMIKRQGEWADRVPVVKTKNYNEAGASQSDQDLIVIPSLRGSKK